MKDRLGDENDENDSGEVKAPKPVVTTDKNPPVKTTKPNKPASTAVTLKQALQNVSESIFKFLISIILSRLDRCGKIERII